MTGPCWTNQQGPRHVTRLCAGTTSECAASPRSTPAEQPGIAGRSAGPAGAPAGTRRGFRRTCGAPLRSSGGSPLGWGQAAPNAAWLAGVDRPVCACGAHWAGRAQQPRFASVEFGGCGLAGREHLRLVEARGAGVVRELEEEGRKGGVDHRGVPCSRGTVISTGSGAPRTSGRMRGAPSSLRVLAGRRGLLGGGFGPERGA